ncbi:hypothetical protein CBP24_10530 [Fischerella thermalis WC439]|nr:hypothetical protein CBP24_10530 [Fischerella thermalis WC439]
MLASGSADGTIKLWNIQTKEEICTLTGHTDEVYSLAFSPDGQILASGSADGSIRIWLVEYQVERGEKPKLCQDK